MAFVCLLVQTAKLSQKTLIQKKTLSDKRMIFKVEAISIGREQSGYKDRVNLRSEDLNSTSKRDNRFVGKSTLYENANP